jgi:Tfp pilus assembly protein PilF
MSQSDVHSQLTAAAPSTALPVPGPHVAVLIGLLLAAVAIYWPSLGYPFAFDDLNNVRNNPAVRMTRVDAENFRKLRGSTFGRRRPVAMLSFALNHRVGGYDTRGYRLVNIAVHVGNAWLVYLLAILLLRRTPRVAVPVAPDYVWAVAAVAALFWAVHPLQTQSVTYIVQRMNSMATLFYLAALCCYLICRSADRRPLQLTAGAGVGCFWLLALGCKEISLVLPLTLYLVEWCFYRELCRRWLVRTAPVLLLLGLAMLAMLVVYAGGSKVMTLLLGRYEEVDYTLVERLLTQPRALVLYVSLLLFPHLDRLNLDHDMLVTRSSEQFIATALSSALLLVLLVAAAVFAWRRRPLAAFCVLWLFVHSLAESTIKPLAMVFEHRMYLPSVGLLIGVVVFLAHVLPRGRRLRLGAATVAGLALLLTAHARSRVWQDRMTLWEDCRDKSPALARPHFNVALEYEKAGREDDALASFAAAIARDADYHEAINNHASILYRRGRVAQAAGEQARGARLVAEAVAGFERALAIDDGNPHAHNNLGAWLAEQGRFDDAIVHFRRAIEIYPKFGDAHRNLGAGHASQGRLRPAAQALRRALALNDQDAMARQMLGTVEQMLAERRATQPATAPPRSGETPGAQ